MTERKATDVLLELEAKVNQMLLAQKSAELNLKILSNKLTTALELLSRSGITTNSVASPPPQPFATAGDDDSLLPKMHIQQEIPMEFASLDPLPIEDTPLGFRRTSRPETFASEAERNRMAPTPPKMPTPAPKNPPVQKPVASPAPPVQDVVVPNNIHRVSVTQRVTDKNGKAIFLAQVEAVNLETGEKVDTVRTNGVGKWANKFGVGKYRVTISKRQSVSKEKLEVSQDIYVDGRQPVIELPPLVVS